MKVLVTGANGFIGKNLLQTLAERADVEVVQFTRDDTVVALPAKVADVDFVIHLAGINRSQIQDDFETGNVDLTAALADALRGLRRPVPLIYSSSAQAAADNPYGDSKRKAEGLLFALGRETGAPAHIFRLPNVFGKWCRPNYNSAVATFCHNIARGLPITVNDPDAPLKLVYIDDLVSEIVGLLDGQAGVRDAAGFAFLLPVYETNVGHVAERIAAFRDSRNTLVTARVGTGFERALYATYVSYLPTELFAYPVPMHTDPRGTFVEMLKTEDSGQFSFFTAYPGVTRGGHYHHSKTEKFLVIKGEALFKFRHMLSGEIYDLKTSGETAQIVETVPGWTHDITNTGSDEMIVMLWANEIFDRLRPDTFAAPLGDL